MPDLRAVAFADDEVDGLDECATGAPEPNGASAFAAEFAMPPVVPQPVRPLAIVALLLAFVVPFVAIPLGHSVLRTSHDGRDRRIAQASIIVGYLTTLLLALVGLNLVVALFLHTA